MKAILTGFLLIAGAAWGAPQGFSAHYLNVGLTGRSKCLALDAHGNSFVVSTVTEPSGRAAIRATKLDASGKIVASLDFGGSGSDSPTAAIADGQGNLIVAGMTSSADFPMTLVLSRTTGSAAFVTNSQTGILPGASQPPGGSISFLAALSSDGTSATALYPAPTGAAGAAIASGPAGIVALGDNGSLLLPATPSAPALLAAGNAAGSSASGVIAPAELITLYGSNLGPATGLGPQVSNHVVASTLGGYQLLFNGVPAPLLYAAANQLNAVVPLGVSGHDAATLQLVTPQGTVTLTTLFVAPAQPAIFRNPETGYAAAVNQDGTLNSRTNPAPRGSVVSVWATGTGVGPLAPSSADGALLDTCTACLFVAPPAIIAESAGGAGAAETMYAGIAPNDVYGVAQINFRLPAQASLQAGMQLLVGGALSDPVQIYVGQ